MQEIIYGNYNKYLLTATTFLFNRVVTTYSVNECLSAKVSGGVLFGIIAATNEFLIDLEIVDSLSYSYIPMAASFLYSRPILPNNKLHNFLASSSISIALKVFYDATTWDQFTIPVISYLVSVKSGISQYFAVGIGIISYGETVVFEAGNNPITLSLLGANFAKNILPPYLSPQIAWHIGCITGLLLSTYQKEIIKQVFPYDTIEAVYKTTHSLFNEKKLSIETEKLLITSSNLYVGAGLLGNYYMRQEQSLINKYFALALNQNNLNPADMQQYKAKIISYILATAVPYLLSRIFCDVSNTYYTHQLKVSLRYELLENILNESSLIPVSRTAKYAIKDYLDDTSNLINRLFVENVNGNDYGIINDIIYLLPKLALITILRKEIFVIFPLAISIDAIYKQFSQHITKLKQEYLDINKLMETKFDQNEKNTRENLVTLLQKGGLENTKETWLNEQNSLLDNISKYDYLKNILSHTEWLYNIEILYNVLRYGVATLIYYKAIGSEDLFLFTVVLKAVTDVICFSSKHQADIESINSSLERLEELNLLLNQSDIDRYKVELKSNSTEFIIEDLHFTRGEKIKNISLIIKDLKLVKGNIYWLTGENGSGKSSFLSLIYFLSKNIFDDSFKYVKGTISHPSDEEILIVPQKDFCPLDITLLELITYPKKLDKANLYKQNKILKLFKELRIEQDDNLLGEKLLHKSHNWCQELSGGQLKKLFLIKAFIECPGILFLDEAFAPLDTQSQKIITHKIKNDSCLQNSLIVIIHHGDEYIEKRDNCTTSDFFDNALYLENGTITAKELECDSISTDLQ
jgi:ABC-type multidrug transport system ATPase subunit